MKKVQKNYYMSTKLYLHKRFVGSGTCQDATCTAPRTVLRRLMTRASTIIYGKNMVDIWLNYGRTDGASTEKGRRAGSECL